MPYFLQRQTGRNHATAGTVAKQSITEYPSPYIPGRQQPVSEYHPKYLSPALQ